MLNHQKIDIFYSGYGESIKNDFYLPVLRNSISYRRLSGFFTIQSLVNVAEGIECMVKKEGSIKLVLGNHDVPKELIKAKMAEGEWNRTLMDNFKESILKGITTLTDEIAKDRLSVFAWMLADGFLKVKIANPKNQDFHKKGIFHSKKLIFKDEEENVVIATGSANESATGFGPSYEELTVFKSWDEQGTAYIETHLNNFNKIWEGTVEELQINNLDQAFAREMLVKLNSKNRPKDLSIKQIDNTASNLITFIRDSPSFVPLNIGNVAMYPHQERVYKDVMSRWPVRALIADEVGLGKTIEAGAIIKSMIKLQHSERILILTPAHVMNQWQEEMAVHFDLNFSVYDSANKKFVDSKGNEERSSSKNPLSNPPNLCIASVYLARGSKSRPHLLGNLKEYPDLLLVDEAHSARINSAMTGGPTLIWKMLDDVKEKIPHLLLLTATPLQVHWGEFHGIMQLLGMSNLYEDDLTYQKSLSILSQKVDSLGYSEASHIKESVNDSYLHYKWLPKEGSSKQKNLFKTITEEGDIFNQSEEILFSKKEAMDLFLRSHPAQFLTVRNSRGSLEKLGYKFPKRNLNAPEIQTDSIVKRFYSLVDYYLQEVYGKYRQALHPDRRLSLGYVKTVFYQRIVSSLYAARRTLQKKASHMEAIIKQAEKIINGKKIDASLTEDLEADWTDYEDSELEIDFFGEKIRANEKINWEKVIRLATVEKIFLKDDLLPLLNEMEIHEPMSDPKIRKLVDVLNHNLVDDKVIVFSHYIDTLEACVQAFVENSQLDEMPDYGYYAGNNSWIKQGSAKFKCSKMDIQNSLREGKIKLLFCSDAASEGINLQAARVLVNIDVPWNPAKLEQRIGRIARIGQKADIVEIINLWYPGSIESEMYGRLMERKELYELAVGELADLISNNIREHIENRSGNSEDFMNQVLDELQNLRQQEQLKAIRNVWGVSFDLPSSSTRIRAKIINQLQKVIDGTKTIENGGNVSLVDENGNLIATSTTGQPKSLNFGNEIIEVFSTLSNKGHNKYTDLYGIKQNNLNIGLCIMDGEDLLVLNGEQLTLVLDSFLGKPLDSSKLKRIAKNNLEELNGFIKEKMIWLPDFTRLSFPGFDDLKKYPDFYGDNFTFDRLGIVGVS